MRTREEISRRSFLKWAGLGATTAYLTACVPAVAPGAASSEPQAAGSAAVEPVKIVLTHWGGEAEAKYMLETANRFMEVEPNIKVEVIHFPDNYDEKLLTMIAGGTPPDVQMTLRFTYFSFVAKGVAINLQPYLDAAKFDPAAYFDVALRPYTFRGNLYGLPREIDDWVVFYNKKLFDEAGVAYPTGEWAWEDLVENAKLLTKRDASGRAQQFGYGFAHLNGAKAYSSFIPQAGGSVVDNVDDPTKFTMAEPGGIEAVQFMADLANVHGVSPSPREQTDLGQVNDLFASGKIAMRFGEFWSSVQYLEVQDFEWDIAEPARGVQQATWVGGACYTVNSGTKLPEESVKLALFGSGPEGAKIVAAARAGVPAIKEIAESPAFLENTPPNNIKASTDVFAYGVQPPMSPTFPEWNRTLNAALDPVWVGEKTAEEALTSVAGEVQALLDQGREMLSGL